MHMKILEIFLDGSKILFTCTGQNLENMQINVGYGFYNGKEITASYFKISLSKKM